jgi:hypothetical protein
MKKFFTILAAFLPLCNLIAQTFLNQDFGSTKTQVQEFLKTRDLARVDEPNENTLVAATDSYTVYYHFDDSGLYKLETVCDFTARKDANDALVGFKAQLQRLAAQVIELNNDKEITRFAALYERELHEVSAFTLTKNAAQVRIVAIDLDRTPGMAMNELRQDNVLFAMIR